MKKKYYIFIIIVLLGITYTAYYYIENSKLKEVITGNYTRPIEELKKLVISKGDTKAYYELQIAYLNVHYYGEEYLLYSIIMADKYNYPLAYFNVYHCLISILERHSEDGKIDEKTKELALKYLKEGVELNDGQSTHELSELYLEDK